METYQAEIHSRHHCVMSIFARHAPELRCCDAGSVQLEVQTPRGCSHSRFVDNASLSICTTYTDIYKISTIIYLRATCVR